MASAPVAIELTDVPLRRTMGPVSTSPFGRSMPPTICWPTAASERTTRPVSIARQPDQARNVMRLKLHVDIDD
ncbi:MAG: hypothetical protein K2X72_32455, partial [Reyranella sp.]|nr:hypothetical protein [Reyranella sp.]